MKHSFVCVLLLSAVAALAPGASGGLQIVVSPEGALFALEARTPGIGYEGSSPYFDLVLQTIWVVNDGAEPLTLEGAAVELLADGAVLQQTAIPTDEFARTQAMAAAISGAGMSAALEVFYAARLLPEGVTPSPGLTLAPRTAGLVDDCYFIVRRLPDEARVTAWARDAAGELVTATASVPVRVHEPRNEYVLPLEPGEWFVYAYPGLKGHHRWTASSEHGYDITMVDERGSWARGGAADWRTGRVPRWEDWYAYGKQVLAAADGEVVKVVDDVEFPLEVWNRRDGESLQAYQARIGRLQMQLLMEPGADPAAVAGGNHVVVRHPGDEYSFYAHLAHGSIVVEEGERVRQGQHIAGLGGIGEAPAVHLHFQVSDGPSMMSSRTLPVQFSDIHVNEQFSEGFEPALFFQPGFFITTEPLGD